MKILPIGLLCLALSVSARAQGAQNTDWTILIGPASIKPHTVGGVAMSGTSGYGYMQGFGHQLKRTSAGSLWLEINPLTILSPGTSDASIGGSVYYNALVFAPGVRLMVPLHARLSVYGIVGAGAGRFKRAEIVDGVSSYVRSDSTWRGVASTGGGVDFRLTTRFSLRAELRDFLTSPGLSGASGRHHLLPLFGVALHH